MSVDAQWLEGVRQKNRQAIGMAGMHGMGYVSSEGLVTKARDERELRTRSIHAGRFTPTDPNKPSEGSVESIAQALGPADVPAPQLPAGLTAVVGLVALGAAGFILYKLTRG